MNGRDTEPSAIAEEPHRIYSWEDVRARDRVLMEEFAVRGKHLRRLR